MARDRISFYFGRDDISVAIGKDAPDSPLVTTWAKRHGATEHHVAPIATTQDDIFHERGDFVAQGDLDLYQDVKDRRHQASRHEHRQGWKLCSVTKQARDEAYALHRILNSKPGSKAYQRALNLLRNRGYDL